MTISEKKMQIVIDNYFKSECDVNTSIRQAFEKGFRIGVKKGQSAESEIIHCKDCIWHNKNTNQCDRQVCAVMYADDFCNYGERGGEQSE